jgi:hypothetical protein
MAMKPDTAIVAVAATHRRNRRPLDLFEGTDLVKVTIAEEHRVYLCDLDTKTVRTLAQIEVPEELRSGFQPIVVGWLGDSVVVRLSGRPSDKPNHYWEETRHAMIGPEGGVRALDEAPIRLVSPRDYRDSPSGRHFLRVIVYRDEVTRSVDDGPEETVFRVDPERSELLPAGP